MYRFSLTLLWVGVGLFAALSVLDAMVDFMGHLQGIFLAGGATCAVCIAINIVGHRLHEAAAVNRGKSEDLQGHVDELQGQVGGLDHKVEEVREWQEAATLIDEAKKPPASEPDREPCPIYQMRLRDGRGREAIVGTRTPDPIDPAEVWPLFGEGKTGTLPGTSAS